jgi:hypothetical protein
MHHFVRVLRSGMLILFVWTLGGEVLQNGNSARASIWQSYSAAVSRPAPVAPQSVPEPRVRSARQSYIAVDDPRYHAESFFGFPRRQDPMFDRNPKPSWRPMIENKPEYDQPEYDAPDYNAPLNRLDPVRKPVYEQPIAVLPTEDKPRYNFKFVEAPGYLAPTSTAPDYRAPNYVIKPIIAPAYSQRPVYDQGAIFYSRPEYQAPVYQPSEYLKPREVAPPVIKPAE